MVGLFLIFPLEQASCFSDKTILFYIDFTDLIKEK